MMKKSVLFLAAIAFAFSTIFTSCKDDSVTGVSLSESTLTLATGAEAALVATVSPSNASDKSVTWTSSNSTVAFVDGNGKVTALLEGTATITATTVDGGFTATCAVTVIPKIENTYQVEAMIVGTLEGQTLPNGVTINVPEPMSAIPVSVAVGFKNTSGNIIPKNTAVKFCVKIDGVAIPFESGETVKTTTLDEELAPSSVKVLGGLSAIPGQVGSHQICLEIQQVGIKEYASFVSSCMSYNIAIKAGEGSIYAIAASVDGN